MDATAVHSYTNRINASVSRADQMISDLLDANLLTSGEKLPMHIECFDLIFLVQKTLDELTIIHKDRFVLNSKKSFQGYWDFRGIRRILENLCNNAIKYGSINTQITVNVFEEAGNAVIEVCNQGDIIPEHEQKNLFQQFRRGRKKSTVKGWGIGLTLVRGVAEAHGGTVKVKSEIESGTVFTIIIPIDARSL